MFRNAARAMLLGLVCTVLVQSSSVTKSLIVPLVGAGFLSLAQVFPYVLGANVGTTVTATLAALVTGEVVSVTVALAHLLFNVTGMLLIWPMRKIPIALSSIVANYTSRSKLIPFVYILLVFFAIPLALIYLVR
jgi:sodium-dependent phosphate cotransporter